VTVFFIAGQLAVCCIARSDAASYGVFRLTIKNTLISSCPSSSL
jgi:hypothetical protein